MAVVPVGAMNGALIELEDIGRSAEELPRLVELQRALYHSQVHELERVVVRQCKLTGVNPLAQEMAAGAMSIKIGKRPRDLLNPKAMKYMQSIFSIKDTIGKKETREISALCGITVTQVRDYFSSQRSKVRKLVRLSHERATKSDSSEAKTNGCCISPDQAVPASQGMPVSTSDSLVTGDSLQDPPNSENLTIAYPQHPAAVQDTFPVGPHLIGNPSGFSSYSSQICGNSANATTVCSPGYAESKTGYATQVPWSLVNATPVSMLVPENSGKAYTVFPPISGYPGIITAGTAVPGSFKYTGPVQNGQLGPTETSSKPVEKDPSCSVQEEPTPGVDSDDKKFLESIFNLMRKEQTFSGRVKLMEWVLQIRNSAVLSWFSTRGGISILASWLREAATEEQTTVILVIFKVLCHLPLSKAQPVQMSTILQTVNRLRFYRSSDISNRAKVLLSRWSKMFVRSRTLRKSRIIKNGQKEMLYNQRTNEVHDDDSWESKLHIPDEILALAESAEDSRDAEPKKQLKMLKDSSDGSSRMLIQSVTVTKTKERRKVLLVEQPDTKAGRSSAVARAVPSNYSRPMSADDIQKAKMRAMHMQDKYGKTNASTCENSPPKTEDRKMPPVSQVPTNKIPQLPLPKLNEVKCSHPMSSTGSTSNPGSTGNPRPNLNTQEQVLGELNMGQIQWCAPPEVKLNSLWRVGAGEHSKEVHVQTQRNKREKEMMYPRPENIPPNPREPWDIEMDFDDSLTPVIPTDQPPELESPVGATVKAPHSLPADNAVGIAPVVNDLRSTSPMVPAPAASGNAIPDPDPELLMVLLKNPEVVEALTKGNLSEEQLVALLDIVKKAGTGLTGILEGIANHSGAILSETKPDPVSLPSPTPSVNATPARWRQEFPSHSSSFRPQHEFSGRHYDAPAVPTATPLTLSLPVMPMGAMTTAQSHLHPQQTVSLNPQPQHHQSLNSHPPPWQRNVAPETILRSNSYQIHHLPQQPLHSQPMKPPAETTALMPEYWSGRLNSVFQDPATNSNYYTPSHNNYNNHSNPNMYNSGNDYFRRTGVAPEFQLSLHNRQGEYDRSNQWLRPPREWSSGHQSQYYDGSGWRDLNHNR